MFRRHLPSRVGAGFGDISGFTMSPAVDSRLAILDASGMAAGPGVPSAAPSAFPGNDPNAPPGSQPPTVYYPPTGQQPPTVYSPPTGQQPPTQAPPGQLLPPPTAGPPGHLPPDLQHPCHRRTHHRHQTACEFLQSGLRAGVDPTTMLQMVAAYPRAWR